VPAALAVACRDIDVRNVKALIIGPHETPYEFGFFEVRSSPVPDPCSPYLTISLLQFAIKFNRGQALLHLLTSCVYLTSNA
jgi:hypothetical protein